MDYGEVTIYDGDDGSVIWKGVLEPGKTVDQVAYPDGVDPGQILDDLTDGQG